MVTSATISLYDSALNLLAEIDSETDTFFKRAWYDIGTFSITINANNLHKDPIRNAEIYNYLQRSTTSFLFPIVMINHDVYKAGFITSIKKSINQDGKGSQNLTITGYELKQMFTWRNVIYLNASYQYYLVDDAETIIKTLIDDQCGPSCTDASRKFSLLTIAANQARGPTYAINCKYTNVADEVMECSKKSLLGWYCYLDLTNKKIILDCSLGLDRTQTQTVNSWAVFSPDYDTLKQADFEDTDANFRNLVYVGGAWAGSARILAMGYSGSEPTDMSRREMFDDASQLTAAADLATEGTAALAQYNQTLILDGQGLAYSPLTLGTDYNLGDKVNIAAYSGDSPYSAIIIEAQESWRHGDYQIDLTWGKPAPTITTQLQALSSSSSLGQGNGESGTNSSTVNNPAITYTFADANLTQVAGEMIYNNLVMTGTVAADRTFTFNFNAGTYDGSKCYNIKFGVTSSAGGPWSITLKTAVASTATVTIPIVVAGDSISIWPMLFKVYIDQAGNVYSSCWDIVAYDQKDGYYWMNGAGIGSNKTLAWGNSTYNEETNVLAIVGDQTISSTLTVPTIYGSSAANGDISIKGTSHTTKTSSFVLLQEDGGNVGLGTIPQVNLDINGTIRSISATGIISSGSGLEISYTGSVSDILSYNRTGLAFLPLQIRGSTISLNGAGEGNVGIGTTGPSSKLDVLGTARFGDHTTNYSDFESDGTLHFTGTATVYDDIQFSVSGSKTPASNYPNWETFTTNTNEYAFDVDEYIDCYANEPPHAWAEGTKWDFHLHITIKALQNAGADRFAKFSIWVAYADANNSVWTEAAAISAEQTIPNGAAALTQYYLDMGDITPTGYHIGTQIKVRVKRIAATGGTEYASSVFITQCGAHFIKDTCGSRTETAK
ncbi:MAG: siphovirus ReqiPepy6 Gp37-like family protein [Candidatus Nanoarchaeia archaeon]|nr:siphovirus ReqiPepy6 Gp37-like family protein [Candidatus Nanoarchaeia archaeon]